VAKGYFLYDKRNTSDRNGAAVKKIFKEIGALKKQ
jgi:hypothetical protein